MAPRWGSDDDRRGHDRETTFGPYFYLHSAWAYGLILAAILLFARRIVIGGDLYRSQTVGLIVGSSLPLAVSVGNTAGLLRPPIPAPVGFAVATVALGYAVFRHRLLDVVPVARDAVIENMRDGVVVLDDQWRVVDANPAARGIAGRDPVGERFDTAFPNCAGLVTGEGNAGGEIALDDGAGTRHFLVELEPLAATEGHGWLATFRDVTERRRRQRQLERTNERLEEFASVVAHDLRNPLNVASGSLDLVGDDPDGVHLNRIERAHDRMEAILTDLLALARQGRTVDETEPVTLAEVAAEAWATAETGDLALDVRTDGVIAADRSRLRQLLENLFRNAAEHAAGATTVGVGTMEGDDRTVGFYVEDDGPGVPPAERSDVFEPGVSSAGDGTGLGLSIVRTIAEAHGWEPSVGEGEAGGARFEFHDVEDAR